MFNLKLIIFIFGICLTVCLASRRGRIVGGSFAQDHQFPHQVSLQYGRVATCGGTILNPNWILTAAHCVIWSYNKSVMKPEELIVRAGTNVVGVGGVVVNVSKIIVHEKYALHLNDLALLKLETPLPLSDTIKSIEMRTEDVPKGAQVTVYGWGRISQNGEPSQTLKVNTLTLLSQKQCSNRFGFDFDQIICLASPVGQGVCKGDSGSGAIYDGKLVGVASFVKECGGKYPDFYVRLNMYHDWIEKNMV